MAGLPPPPINDAPGSFTWLEWYRQLRNYVSTSGSVPWYIINFAGSNITDIALRDHNQLQNVQGGDTGEMYHLTAAQYAALTAGNHNDLSGLQGGTLNEYYHLKQNDYDMFDHNGNFVVRKDAGYGIKVDTSTPTFGWEDMLGPITVRGSGPTDPAYSVYRGGLRAYQFGVNDEVFVEFHILHDYAVGTDLYLHTHWSHAGTNVTGGSVTWGYEITYAKGHNQAPFSTPVTGTITQNASTTQYQHMIAETQISASSPSGSQIDTDNLEVDGLILVRIFLSANNMTVSGGGVPDPFLHMTDIHYQSTGITTKNKAPNFYA